MHLMGSAWLPHISWQTPCSADILSSAPGSHEAHWGKWLKIWSYGQKPHDFHWKPMESHMKLIEQLMALMVFPMLNPMPPMSCLDASMSFLGLKNSPEFGDWHEMTHDFQHNYANSNEINYILRTNAIINSSMKNIKFSFQPTLLTPSHSHLLQRWATAWKFSRTYRGWWFGSQAMPSSDSKDDSLIGWNLIGAHSICW